MGLRLLGPLKIVVGDREFKIGGPRERALLATLALRANRVTSLDHLVDAVWADDPPSSARTQIQVCISGMRKLFRTAGQPGAIESHSPGYTLVIPCEELDSQEFTRLVADAKAQAGKGVVDEAAATLRRALALWHGPALVDVRSDVVRRGAALLDDARLAAEEERVRLDLELCRHEEILGELRALVEEHPLSERLYRFLMLALYRSGRQVEALEIARRARDKLIDEVGVEPGPELTDLEMAILNRDPALELRPAGDAEPSTAPADEEPRAERITPRQLPGITADFVGREDDIAMITRSLSDDTGTAAPYGMRIVAISGRGGVGKTALALRVAHELSCRFPDGQFFANMAGSDEEDRTTRVLTQFLHALGVVGATMPEDLHERVVLYRSLLADKRLLIVLDDARSEEDVQPLLPGGPGCLVIATCRTRLTGLTGARRIHVDVLDTATSMKLLAKILGPERVHAERDDAAELVNLCGGLPLALRIAGARLASRPHWRIAGLVRRLADEAHRLDEFSHRGLELRTSIGLTYRSLSLQAQRLFRMFALVHVHDFPAWTAAALLDTDLFTAEDLLAVLVDAQLLDTVEYPGERIRYRIHELIRIYAAEQLAATETDAERHDALGRLLGAWLAFAEKAHRAEYGGDYAILHGGAARWEPVNGTDDADDGTFEWLDSERRALVGAIRQAAAAGMDELCWDLALTAMSLFEVKGYFDDWRETTQLALETARCAGNRVGEAAMMYSLGSLHMVQKRLDDASRCLTTSLTIFEEERNLHGYALALRDIASVDRMRGDFATMLAGYDKALCLMRQVGDPIGEATIQRSIAKYLIDEGDLDGARTLLEEALATCERVNHLRGKAQVLNRMAELYLGTGEIALARQAVHRVLRVARRLGDRVGEAHALYRLGLVRRREGRLDHAETTLRHALALAEQVGERLIEGMARFVLGEIELARDEMPAALAELTIARGLFVDLGAALWHAKALIRLAEVHEIDGDSGQVCEHLEQATQILRSAESEEAKKLLAQVSEIRSALPPENSLGE